MAYIGPAAANNSSSHSLHPQPHDNISSVPPQKDNSVANPSTATMDNNDTSLTQKMMSAVSGSILTSLLVTPLDVVRVRLQAQSGPSPFNAPIQPSFERLPPNLGISSCCREVYWVPNQSSFCIASAPEAQALDRVLISQCAAEEAQRRSFSSTLDGLKKIARNEGLSTLWRGLSPTLLMSVPSNVIYFAGYDWLRQNPRSPVANRVNDTYVPLVAGSAARTAAAIVVGPVEMFRTRMQASHPEAHTPTGVFKDTLQGVKDMVKTDGYRSLWRGLGLTLWRDVPFSALYWWGYEYGREALHTLREDPDAQDATGKPRSRSIAQLDHRTVLIDSFIAGATSGAIAAFVTTPFDVGKTRQQVARHAPDASSNSAASAARAAEDKSIPRLLWNIYKTEGTAGLFKGWTARCGKVAPACAIMISSYEIGKKMAGSINERKAKDL